MLLDTHLDVTDVAVSSRCLRGQSVEGISQSADSAPLVRLRPILTGIFRGGLFRGPLIISCYLIV